MPANSKRSIVSGTLALVLALPCAPLALTPSRALAAAPEGEPATVRVVVDASSLGEDAEYWEGEAAAIVGQAIEAASYEVVDSASAEATVRLRLYYYNEVDLDYQLDVDITAGEEVVRLETVGCPGCVDGALKEEIADLGGAVNEGIATALERAGNGQEDDGGDDDGGEDGGEEVKPMGPLGGAGIGLGVLGLGGVIAGAVELSRGKVYDDPTTKPLKQTFVDHTPVGGVLVGAGAAVFIAGTVMLVVDVVGRSKKRKQQRAQRQVAYPLLSPGMMGAGYTVNF